MALVLWLLACSPARDCSAGDEDCDGVPDEADRCAHSNGEPTDAGGCTDDQMAGCAVVADSPPDRSSVRGPFAWHGTCDVYLLQFSDDATFPAGRTRTAARTTETTWTASSTERFWRVVGGRTGSSRGFTTEPRELW
jgi:hypothetical protein